MNELIYGFWKGVVFDTRRGICADLTSFPSSKYFNRGNPITGIATAEGFLIYDHRVTLLRVVGLLPKNAGDVMRAMHALSKRFGTDR